MSAGQIEEERSLVYVRSAIEAELKVLHTAAAEKYGREAMVGFSFESERARLTELIANSIYAGTTTVFQRKDAPPDVGGFDGVEPVDLSNDGELGAWLAGMRGYQSKEPLGLSRPGSDFPEPVITRFVPVNDRWLGLLVESPVDWTVVRTGRPAVMSDELSDRGRGTYEKIIVALMLNTGRFAPGNAPSWVTLLERELDRAGVKMSDRKLRDIVNGVDGKDGKGAYPGLRPRLMDALDRKSKKVDPL